MSGLPSWARAGAKVVCVDGDFSRFPAKLLACAPNRPVTGCVYTIRRARLINRYGVFFLLEEVRNPPCDYGRWHGEAQFGIDRFRPAITLEDDLKAHFSHHLDAPVRVSEEA